MFETNGTNITLPRGDSLYVAFVPQYLDGQEYTPESSDKITFKLRNIYTDVHFILQKDVSIDDFVLYLRPADTENLPKKTYCYSVVLSTGGDVYTYIEGKLKLT